MEKTNVFTQSMVDMCLKVDSAALASEQSQQLTALVSSKFALSNTEVQGQGSNPKTYRSLGTRLVAKTNLFFNETYSTFDQIKALITSSRMAILEIVVLSATESRFVKIADPRRASGSLARDVSPDQLVVVLESKTGYDLLAKAPPNSAQDTNPALTVIRDETTAETAYRMDSGLRSLGMSRSQAEDEGMLLQINSAEFLPNWQTTGILAYVDFLLPPGAPEITIVDVDLGLRLVCTPSNA